METTNIFTAKLYKMTVKVDTNDMDYRTKVYSIDGATAQVLAGLFMSLKKSPFSGEYIWDVEEYDTAPMREKYSQFTDEQFDLLVQYIPTCENGYTRSICSVTLIPAGDEIKIL